MVGPQYTETADAEQAAVFRAYFGTEREDLVHQLAKLTKQLTNAVKTGLLTDVGQLRRAIRGIENNIRVIDRMLDGLDRRFPADEVRQRA